MKLTPFSKILLATVVVGAVGYGLWKNQSKLPIKFDNINISMNSGGSGKAFISAGDNALSIPNEFKTAGIENYKNKDYAKAAVEFSKAISVKRNDGESLIYLENSNIMMTKTPHYTIAVAGPFSGKYSQKGEAQIQGVAYAQKILNSHGGIAGKKIFVVLGDDKSSSEGAIEVAKEFVEQKDVLAVIGHIASGASLAAAPVYENGKLTMISPSSGSSDLTLAGQYIFRVIPADDVNSKILAKYVISNLKIKKIGIFKDSADQYSQGLANAFNNELVSAGGKVVDTKEFSTIPVTNQASVQAMVSGGAEGILIAGSAPSQAIAVAEAAKEISPQIKLIGGHALYLYELLKDGKENVEGMYVSSPWHAKVPKPEVQTYAKSFGQMFGGQANARSALASDAAFLIAGVLEKNPDIDRTGLMTKLSGIGTDSPAFDGTTGRTSFDKNGDVVKPIVILQVKNNQFIPVTVFK